MKIELQRNSVLLEIDLLGRQIFINEGEASQTNGYFDDGEARAAFDALVAEREAQGWTLSAKEQAKRSEREQKETRAKQRRERIAAAIAGDPRVGARSLLSSLSTSPRFEELIERVERIDDAEGEPRLRFRGGAHMLVVVERGPSEWKVPVESPAIVGDLSQLWLTLTPDGRDSNFYFGVEAGPPEPGLEGTRFEDSDDVEWVIAESPWDRYWFHGDGAYHCYEFDGGLHDDEFRGTLAELLVLRILTLMER